jgi:hypothetical protein
LVGHSDGGRGNRSHEYGYAEDDEGKIFVSGGMQTKAKTAPIPAITMKIKAGNEPFVFI